MKIGTDDVVMTLKAYRGKNVHIPWHIIHWAAEAEEARILCKVPDIILAAYNLDSSSVTICGPFIEIEWYQQDSVGTKSLGIKKHDVICSANVIFPEDCSNIMARETMSYVGGELTRIEIRNASFEETYTMRNMFAKMENLRHIEITECKFTNRLRDISELARCCTRLEYLKITDDEAVPDTKNSVLEGLDELDDNVSTQVVPSAGATKIERDYGIKASYMVQDIYGYIKHVEIRMNCLRRDHLIDNWAPMMIFYAGTASRKNIIVNDELWKLIEGQWRLNYMLNRRTSDMRLESMEKSLEAFKGTKSYNDFLRLTLNEYKYELHQEYENDKVTSKTMLRMLILIREKTGMRMLAKELSEVMVDLLGYTIELTVNAIHKLGLWPGFGYEEYVECLDQSINARESKDVWAEIETRFGDSKPAKIIRKSVDILTPLMATSRQLGLYRTFCGGYDSDTRPCVTRTSKYKVGLDLGKLNLHISSRCFVLFNGYICNLDEDADEGLAFGLFEDDTWLEKSGILRSPLSRDNTAEAITRYARKCGYHRLIEHWSSYISYRALYLEKNTVKNNLEKLSRRQESGFCDLQEELNILLYAINNIYLSNRLEAEHKVDDWRQTWRMIIEEYDRMGDARNLWVSMNWSEYGYAPILELFNFGDKYEITGLSLGNLVGRIRKAYKQVWRLAIDNGIDPNTTKGAGRISRGVINITNAYKKLKDLYSEFISKADEEIDLTIENIRKREWAWQTQEH